MSNVIKAPDIIVQVEGGVVQAVYVSDSESEINVRVIDMDNIKAEEPTDYTVEEAVAELNVIKQFYKQVY